MPFRRRGSNSVSGSATPRESFTTSNDRTGGLVWFGPRHHDPDTAPTFSAMGVRPRPLAHSVPKIHETLTHRRCRCGRGNGQGRRRPRCGGLGVVQPKEFALCAKTTPSGYFSLHIKENVLDISFFTLYAHQMSNPPAAAGLAFQPRKGFGARVASGFSRVGTALQSAVASGLRRSKCDPDRRTTPDADKPAAARQAHAPRPPSRTRTGVLARLFRRRLYGSGPSRAIPRTFRFRRYPTRRFPTSARRRGPSSTRRWMNAILESLGIVLEALAEVIARTMAPQEGMSDARDVFLALRGRLAAVQGEPGGAPPAALPEAAGAPADLAASRHDGPPSCLARVLRHSAGAGLGRAAVRRG